uniref:DDE-1 domain-containing protein n=1 Tax=Latimeria chalumnae TaxID=7897 RepID=H3B1Y0_LATCH
KKFNVPRTTLNSWLENKDQIVDVIDADTFSVNQKQMWTSTHSDIENCLLAWLCQARAQSILVSNPILTEKANQFADNCPAHPRITGLKAVRLQFLPPNTTSHTQPLDSDVIRNFKLHYRHDLAMHALIAADSRNTFKMDVLRSITIMKKAWDLVEKETIANCFHHCSFTREQPAGEDNVLEEKSESEESSHFNNTVDQLRIVSLWPTDVSQGDFIDVDAVVSVSELTSDSDIVAAQSTIDKPDHDDDEEEENNNNILHPPIKIAAGIAAVDMLQLLLAQQGIEDAAYQLSHLSVVLASLVSTQTRQNITDYFSK